MGGFASGFRAGYGLVNDTYEGIRREQQDAAQTQFNQDKLAAEQARLQQDSRYNSERLRLQGESNRQGADYNQRRLELEGEYNRDRLAELRDGNRIAENKFQVEAVLGGAGLASQLRQEDSDTKRDQAYVDYYTAQAEGQRLENVPVMQREATRTAVNELQNSGTLSVNTLRSLQGTGLNAAKFLSPDAPIQLGNAYAFATGRRTDYDSAEFAGALNWLFESDTAAMIGQKPEGRNGAIVKQTIIGMEPVKGRDDAFKLVVQNQLDNGEVYSSYITQGRRAGAPAAEMTMETIGQKLDANSAAAEAFNRPELAAQLLSQYAQLDPQVAIDAAAMRQEDITNAKTVLTQEEYMRTAVGMRFGRINPQALSATAAQRDQNRAPAPLAAPDYAAIPDSGAAQLYSQGQAQALPQDPAPVTSGAPRRGITISDIRRAALSQNPGAAAQLNQLSDEEIYKFWEQGDIAL